MIPRCLLNQTMSLAAETTLKNLRYLQDKRVFKKFSNSLKNELAKELLEKIPIYLHLFQHSGSSKANASYINRKSWREEWEECPDNFLFDEVAAWKTSGEDGKSPTSFFSDKKLSVNSYFGDFATSTRQKNDSDSLKDAQWPQVSLAYFSQGRIFFSAEIWGRYCYFWKNIDLTQRNSIIRQFQREIEPHEDAVTAIIDGNSSMDNLGLKL